MNPPKALVLDANILIRGVLGKRVRWLLRTYMESVAFCAADSCFEEARQYVPHILANRGEDPEVGMGMLSQIESFVQPVNRALYSDFEQLARRRIAARDVKDWPTVAVALMLSAPVWTEDQDFFGSGISTWTTDRVEQYLSEIA